MPCVGLPADSRIWPLNLRRKRLAVGPDSAILEVLFLPDRDGAFQRVDQPAAGVKRGGAMSRNNPDQNAGLTDFKPPQAMHNRQIANLKLLHSLLAEGFHLPQSHLFVSLVVEVERLATTRLVAHYTLKNNDGAVFPTLQFCHDAPRIDAVANDRTVAPASFRLPRGRLVRTVRCPTTDWWQQRNLVTLIQSGLRSGILLIDRDGQRRQRRLQKNNVRLVVRQQVLD